MRIFICLPTGDTGIKDEEVIKDAVQTAVNRIFLCGENQGEFEADENRNICSFEVKDYD